MTMPGEVKPNCFPHVGIAQFRLQAHSLRTDIVSTEIVPLRFSDDASKVDDANGVGGNGDFIVQSGLVLKRPRPIRRLHLVEENSGVGEDNVTDVGLRDDQLTDRLLFSQAIDSG